MSPQSYFRHYQKTYEIFMFLYPQKSDIKELTKNIQII